MDAVDTAEVERFRTDLAIELGESPSVTRRALGEALVANYASIVLLNKELQKARHKNRLRVSELEKPDYFLRIVNLHHVFFQHRNA
jgi:hypothetical protein